MTDPRCNLYLLTRTTKVTSRGELLALLMCSPSAKAARANAQIQRDVNVIHERENVPLWTTEAVSDIACIGKADLTILGPNTIVMEQVQP